MVFVVNLTNITHSNEGVNHLVNLFWTDLWQMFFNL